ncbi:MAG: TonB-dependent receptor [Sphingomonas sp.]
MRHCYALLVVASSFALVGPVYAQEKGDAGPSLDDSIIVTGKRLHGETGAIDEKRRSTATVSIMSADEIAKRPGGNLADIISHLPGLVGYNDMGKGQAATGEREYVAIRGLDSNYDSYLLNGVRVPAADPGSRALSLNFVAPYGLDSVIVTKSPTADMIGDGIGGVVDIHTPGAFSLGKSFTKVTVAGNFSQLAQNLGFASLGGTGQIEIAREFGDHDQFGVYVTAFYDRSSTAGEAIESGGYRPTLKSEADVSDWRKLTGGLSLDQLKYDLYSNQERRYGGSLALGYRNDGQEFYLRTTYGHYDDRGNDSQRSIRNDGDRYFNSTTFNPQQILPGGYFQTRDKDGELYTIQVGGITDHRKGADHGLTLAYDLSLGRSSIGYPNYVEGSLYAPPVPGNAQFDLSDPAHPVPRFSSPAVGSYVLNPNTDQLWKFQGHDGKTTNRIVNAKLDGTYRIGGLLQSLKGGFDVSFSRRNQYDHEYTGNDGDNFAILKPDGTLPAYYDGQGGPLGGLPGRNIASFLNGLYPGLYRFLDRSTFVNGMLPYAYQDHFAKDPVTGLNTVGNPGAYTIDDYQRRTVSGTEDIYAAYLQARFASGPFAALAGLRFERTQFSAAHWVSTTVDANGVTQPGHFTTDGNRYDQWLPNLTLVYRPDDKWVARLAAHRSFSRPAFSLVAGPEDHSYDPVAQITYYTLSNPKLKPAESTNVDSSIEFYPKPGALLELGGYYRHIRNFIYSASTTGGDPDVQSPDTQIGANVYSQPENGKSAELFGLEANGRYQFTELGGWTSGLGLGGNLTLQHSEADSNRSDHYGRKTWLPRAPQLMYNIDLFYERRGLSAELSYQYTGLQLLSLTDNNLDAYMQPIKTLDLGVTYMIGGFSVGLQIKNLLDQTQFYKTLGRENTYLGTQDGGGNGSYVETGRFVRVATSYKF